MPHMPSSPFTVNGLADGQADGARDAALVSQCPPGMPLGMDPAKSWSVRYQRGYEEAFQPAPCTCGEH